MTAEPLPPPGKEPIEEPTEKQAALTEALRALRDLGGNASPELSATVARLLETGVTHPEPRLRLVGRTRKISVSMPEDLMNAVQQRVGRGEVSQYVAEAVARHLELDLLGELSALLEAEHGPIAEETLAEARRSWPDAR